MFGWRYKSTDWLQKNGRAGWHRLKRQADDSREKTHNPQWKQGRRRGRKSEGSTNGAKVRATKRGTHIDDTDHDCAWSYLCERKMMHVLYGFLPVVGIVRLSTSSWDLYNWIACEHASPFSCACMHAHKRKASWPWPQAASEGAWALCNRCKNLPTIPRPRRGCACRTSLFSCVLLNNFRLIKRHKSAQPPRALQTAPHHDFWDTGPRFIQCSRSAPKPLLSSHSYHCLDPAVGTRVSSVKENLNDHAPHLSLSSFLGPSMPYYPSTTLADHGF